MHVCVGSFKGLDGERSVNATNNRGSGDVPHEVGGEEDWAGGRWTNKSRNDPETGAIALEVQMVEPVTSQTSGNADEETIIGWGVREAVPRGGEQDSELETTLGVTGRRIEVEP